MIPAIIRLGAAIFLSLFFAALVLITIPINRKGRVFHALARMHARSVLAVCGVRVTVDGAEKLEPSRSYIYVSNHASYFDIPVVIAGIPDQIRIVYKKELERIPLFGWGLKFGKTYISIDRRQGQDALQSLGEAAGKIRTGASVLLFAEGTRTSDGELQPFKRGPFNLAVKAGIPVVPVTINGSYDVLPRHSWRIRPGPVTLVLGDVIEPPAPNGKETELALRDRVHEVIQRSYRS